LPCWWGLASVGGGLPVWVRGLSVWVRGLLPQLVLPVFSPAGMAREFHAAQTQVRASNDNSWHSMTCKSDHRGSFGNVVMWWRNSLNLGHSLFGQAYLLPSDSIQKYRAFRRALELVARALRQQEITCMDLVTGWSLGYSNWQSAGTTQHRFFKARFLCHRTYTVSVGNAGAVPCFCSRKGFPPFAAAGLTRSTATSSKRLDACW
jgi:hypothetical protein